MCMCMCTYIYLFIYILYYLIDPEISLRLNAVKSSLKLNAVKSVACIFSRFRIVIVRLIYSKLTVHVNITI